MWVDTIIVIILVFTIVQGFRHGFVHTFIHTVGWVLAVILGFVWYPHVITFLKEKTGFYDSVHGKITERITENAGNAADSAMTGIPEVIRDLLDKAVDSATNAIAVSMSDNLSNLIFNILGFLIVAIAIKIILLILTILFSKEKNSGFIGGIDGFFGLLAGAAKGAILVYILLALMVPLTSLSGSSFLMDQLDGSVFGSYLYDNNIILGLVKGFL
ncbi:MAG: CvpA family protein [Bacillota bacterium]